MWRRQGRGPGLLFAATALGILLWVGAAWTVQFGFHKGASIGGLLFRTQDMPALIFGAAMLLICAPFASKGPPLDRRGGLHPVQVTGMFVIFALAAWLLYRLVFHSHPLSRDEEVAEFAAAYFREGLLARPIPPEWVPYRRAIMPEFFSPFGADHFWASAYLPVNSAIRAVFLWLGAASWAGPALVLTGLVALWRVALRLFPNEKDALIVVLVMTLGSAQLLFTAMTAYAMTAHFAFNMVWLALVLRDRRWSHALAGVVAILAAGLHQWHFPLIFLAPFLLWFGLQRRWRLLAFHAAILVLAVVIWGKLWPQFLLDQLGPPADVMPAAGVGDKMGSLVSRLSKWHPHLHLARFVAWNNLLLVPLSVVAVFTMNWREALRGKTVELPLALGCLGASALAIDQGYGWGYRYLNGYIGCFALLAAYGWTRMRHRSLRPIWISVVIAVAMGSFLAARMATYSNGYARARDAILASKADIVIVDPRGGRYAADLVWGRDHMPLGKPVVMYLGAISSSALGRLCDRYSIAIMDRRVFLPLGVNAMNWGNANMVRLRAQMERRKCGALLIAPPR